MIHWSTAKAPDGEDWQAVPHQRHGHGRRFDSTGYGVSFISEVVVVSSSER